MSNFEIMDGISELKIAIGKAKAVAEAFGDEFIDPDTVERRIIAIQAAPERYEYLYAALVELLHNVNQQIIALDEAG